MNRRAILKIKVLSSVAVLTRFKVTSPKPCFIHVNKMRIHILTIQLLCCRKLFVDAYFCKQTRDINLYDVCCCSNGMIADMLGRLWRCLQHKLAKPLYQKLMQLT